jgi:hypothetical protein
VTSYNGLGAPVLIAIFETGPHAAETWSGFFVFKTS